MTPGLLGGRKTIIGSRIGGAGLSSSATTADIALLGYKAGLRVSYVDGDTVRVGEGQLELADSLYDVAQTDLTFAALDTGAEAVGTNYYVWATTAAGVVALALSASAAAPTGAYDDYRLLGWFHNNPSSNISRYSVATANADGDVDSPAYGPKPGMVMLPDGRTMVDIYIASNAGNTGKAIHAGVNAAASAYNATPWVSRTYFDEWKSCANAGKRLCTNEGWSKAALGTPAGQNNNDVCWTAVANTGSHPTGTLPACVSTVGCYDLTGNVWERVATWGDNTDVAADQSGWGWAAAWTAQAEGGGAYTPFGANAGPDGLTGPRALIRGGSWGNSTLAGGWTVFGYFAPRGASSYIGFRCCS